MRAALAAATLATVFALAGAQRGAAAAPASELQTRLDRLEAEVSAGEDIAAIKRLQRAYGYYLDKGMWADLAEVFTDDAVANYPAGIFIGKESIGKHLFMNVGGHKMGEIGLGDNRLYDHMNIQPVVHLDPGGKTAKGRWRDFAMFGSMGGGATWAEGVYELSYAKDHGVWKIQRLEYHAGFGAPYATGWAGPAEGTTPPTPRPRRTLAHPADRERKMECEGFPAACIAPFHYENPGKSDSAHAWIIDEGNVPTGKRAAVGVRVAELAQRVTRLQDEQQIE